MNQFLLETDGNGRPVGLTKIPGLYGGGILLPQRCPSTLTELCAVQAPSKISKEESKAETATEAREWGRAGMVQLEN